MPSTKVVGLMSGTSGDGIDAALVEISGRKDSLRVRVLSFVSVPYARSLRQRVLAVSLSGTVAEVCHLNVLLGEVFARTALLAIKKARINPSEVRLIGSHGQTIHHLPKGIRESPIGLVRSTLQIAEPAVIAERTGITTIANFRARDMAAGGEGAPLAPYAHYLLMRHAHRNRLIVNLGGISNVTYLPKGENRDRVVAFDTGPANMVLDALVQRLSKGRTSFDRGGTMAARGIVHPGLLKELMRHPYLKRRPPKSTGREEFGGPFIEELLARQQAYHLGQADLLATCAQWTAASIGAARRWVQGDIDEVVVGGGGVYNRTVMRNLARVFGDTPVKTFDDLGWNSKAFEAIAFAVLAYRTASGTCNNLPRVTGAHHAVVLGTIVPGRIATLRRK